MPEIGSPAEPATPRRAFVRRAGPLLTVIGVWLVSAVLWLQPGLVLPDGAGYVVYLPSAWLQQDLLFFDEWQTLGMIENGIIRHKDVTSTGHLGNHWTVGSALAWFPAFALADAVQPLFPQFPRNGFSAPYNMAVLATSALAGLLTLLAGYGLARPIAGPAAAAAAAIGAWFGTTLLWYSLAHATMAHAISAMAAALVFVAAMAMRKNASAAMAMLAGIAVGFAFAVRPQNAPLFLVPLVVAPFSPKSLPWYGAGIAAGAMPQLVVSWFLYGSPAGFLTGGGSATPFAAFEKVWLWEPLFSWYHGLFTWTPLAAAGVIGLFLLLRIDRRLAMAGLLMFFAQWAINATMERSFWGALSFGQRRFDSCIIVFIIGTAALLRALPPLPRILVVALPSVWTFSLFLAARGALIDLSRYIRPGDLFDAQIAAITDVASALVPLGTTPPWFKATAALLGLLYVTLLAALAILARRLPPTAAAAAAATFLFASSVFLFWCGTRDGALAPRYAALVERNRVFASIPGGADVRFALLRDEIEYLTMSGRAGEAEETARELAGLEARRAEAIRRLIRREE